MGGAPYAFLLYSVVCLAVGTLSIAVSVRERRRDLSGWAWLLPGTFGILLILGCALRLLLLL